MNPYVPAALAGLAVAVAVALPSGAAARLQDALPAAPSRRRRLPVTGRRGASVALAGALGLVAGGPALAAVAVVGVLVATAAVAARARAAGEAAERAGAVEACAVLAAELRAGRAPGEALEAATGVAAGPLRDRLAAAGSAVRFGGDPASALLAPGPTSAVPDVVAGLAACWQVCAGTGSGLAAAVERLEEGVRSGAEARRAVEAELAGPRATASLLALLPLAGIGMAALLGARPLHVLLETTAGSACLVLGVTLDLAGVAWTRRIAGRAAAC